ncbi:MAG: YtxH domain-containing protein [Tissierellia bacterium]|nr:YtxH domain-containing protein [Tissierellia bacterium]
MRELREESARSLAIGAILGAVAGVLFAPKSGEETRSDIANRSRELAEQAKEQALDASDKLSVKAYEAQEAVRNTYDDLKLRAAERAEDMRENVEVARAKAQAIGEIVREEASYVKDEVDHSMRAISEEAKYQLSESAAAAKDAKEQIVASGRAISQEAKMVAENDDDLPSDEELELQRDKGIEYTETAYRERRAPGEDLHEVPEDVKFKYNEDGEEIDE